MVVQGSGSKDQDWAIIQKGTCHMKKILSLISIAALGLTASPVMARGKYVAFRGKDGRMYCRKADGTVGAIGGAVVGGILGNVIVGGGGDRTLGTLLGAGGGAIAGRAIERRRRVSCPGN